MIYYPIPAHRQLMFSAFGCESLDLPVTDYLTERVISLPMHTEMKQDQRDYIVSTVQSFFKQL
jgi:dTDP-4-amino-4,6-dideoxygalactose transaminase